MKLNTRSNIHSPDACQRTHTSDYADLFPKLPRTDCSIELGLDLIDACSGRGVMLLGTVRLLKFGVRHSLNWKRIEDGWSESRLELKVGYLK